MNLADQIRFFEDNHYLLIPGALAHSEIQQLNAAIDRDRLQFPDLWTNGPRMQSATCLLNLPEADFLLRHSAWLPLAQHLLDDDIVFDEFSVMIRAGNQQSGKVEGWHRDVTPDEQHR